MGTKEDKMIRHVESIYARRIKRITDFVVALFLILFLSPVIGILALILLWCQGRPVLFSQRRIGLHQREFIIYKFRTMRVVQPGSIEALSDSERLTGVGKVIRGLSLDELPQLLNVLLGEMSLVGPRPLLPRYLPYYRASERCRHKVRPGITGWAQVHGRNRLGWDERFDADRWYVEHISLVLDLFIVVKTVTRIVSRDGLVVDPRRSMLDLDVERSVPPLKTGCLSDLRD